MQKVNEVRPLLPEQVSFVLGELRAAGYPAYVVGGSVRDALMGRTPGDYDVTTAARPEELLRVFSSCRVVETGLKHGTLTVVLDGMNIEVTTYRIDGAYSDGRRPDSVSFADRLSDDLCRRDFTVNAMAWSPEPPFSSDGTPSSADSAGRLIDLFGGREDLERRVIRCVGSAEERFSEDGLRILRALRFAAVLDFFTDPECAAAVRTMASMLDKISRERIHAELTKLLAGPAAGRILAEFAPVFARFLPPLTEEAVLAAARVFSAHPPAETANEAVRYAVLFDSLSAEEAARAMDSLKPSRDEKRAVLNLLNRRASAENNEPPDRYSFLCLMRDTDDRFPELSARFLRLTGRIGEEEETRIRSLCEDILEKDDCRRIGQLEADGADLLNMGFRGAEIGETLKRLLECVMRGELPNERNKLLEELESMTDKETRHAPKTD